jgi:hypothetical protein
MCYERYLWRRRREAEEDRDLWQEFDRTRPIADPEPQAEVTEPEPTEAREELTTSER